MVCISLLAVLRLSCRGSDFACNFGDSQCVITLLCFQWQRLLVKLLQLPSRCVLCSRSPCWPSDLGCETHTAAWGQTLAAKWRTCSQGLRIARNALHWFNPKDSVDQTTAWVWDSLIYLLHANFSFSKLAMKFCWRCRVLLWCTLTSQYVH